MTQIGPEGETTETTAIDPPVRIVAKPPEGDLEAIGRYYRPYYELAEHALLAGLTPSELEFFKSKNIPIISLGSQILRAETAAIAVLSIALLIEY